ncbi:hypothetical protein FB004_103222 [Sinorhizobium medicae]|uniref:hypothetical protein n=1 Tax=Sinorhizobium medicae TaxID=110321 RepID=UPI0011AC2187|nr:hypothetical protein [Sinorhizobium medicae]TWA26116.1 hypothetical protein FB004_103222 [Sinorhizobium medicae]
MPDMVMVAAENERLRRCMNDILSVTALPAAWTGGTVDGICSALLDALRSILDVDFLVVNVAGSGDQAGVLKERSRTNFVDAGAVIISDLVRTLGANIAVWPRETNVSR